MTTDFASSVPAVDHAAVQARLAASYQAALARAGGDRRAVDEEGRAALADLVEDITPLLRKILLDKLHHRFGAVLPDGLAEECYAEMVAAVVDAAGRFDPARCPSFYSWVTGEQGEARAALSACVNFATGRDGLDARALRALAIAAQAETNLEQELGRAPTTVELQAAMTEYSYRYQFDRLTAEQQQLPEEQWRKLVHTKLTNNSMLANIGRIGTLRQNASRMVSPEEFATGWDFLEDPQDAAPSAAAVTEEIEAGRDVADLIAVGLAGLSPRHKQIVAARLAGQDAQDASLSAVANRFRVTVAEVKDLVAGATARMGAAHAHYAFLAAGLGSQFEEAPAAELSGVAGILGRLRPALA